MNNGNADESKLWATLSREQLVDLSQFHKPKFFDEVPLFSRYSDIDFLSEYGSTKADSILLKFALKFLKEVVHYENHRSPYFAAITVWNSSESDPVVPNIFFWSGSIRPLQKLLVLNVVKTSFGRTIKQRVSGGKAPGGIEVLEDTSTDPGDTRVFLSFSQPPYKSFASLGKFRRTKRLLNSARSRFQGTIET